MRRGDEAWVQFLSEPTSGSDLAAVMTRATPDGDDFVRSGSKIWSSGAYAADYAIDASAALATPVRENTDSALTRPDAGNHSAGRKRAKRPERRWIPGEDLNLD